MANAVGPVFFFKRVAIPAYDWPSRNVAYEASWHHDAEKIGRVHPITQPDRRKKLRRPVNSTSGCPTLNTRKMTLTLNSARALRDGGIDAAAALDDALKDALIDLPVELHSEVKLAFGRAMAAVLGETVDLAIRAYPELKPDAATWMSVARIRAAKRASK